MVNQSEASAIIGIDGGNVKKLEKMTGTIIDAKGGKGASQRTVQISGEKAAVEKTEELVSGFLFKNCTTSLELSHQEAMALVGQKGKLLNLFRKKWGVDFFIDFEGVYGKARKLYFLGLEDEVKKAKQRVDDFLESVLLLPISHAEKNVLLCGGKKSLLCDISKKVDAHCSVKDLNLMIFGSPEERKKAASTVKEQLRLKMT